MAQVLQPAQHAQLNAMAQVHVRRGGVHTVFQSQLPACLGCGGQAGGEFFHGVQRFAAACEKRNLLGNLLF